MPDNQIKVLHSQYKFNTKVERGGVEQDYVVVYFENNATDVMMHGYTQVPREHIHTQGDINNKRYSNGRLQKSSILLSVILALVMRR